MSNLHVDRLKEIRAVMVEAQREADAKDAEIAKLKYQIKHLIRAVEEADAKVLATTAH